MNTSLPYEYQESEKTDEGVKYFFVSKGKRDVVKVIHYMCSATMNDRKVFNLGFGDYELEKDIIDDKMNTDNGDVYKVFNTVLYTIPVMRVNPELISIKKDINDILFYAYYRFLYFIIAH
jgi:hypothetical protein